MFIMPCYDASRRKVGIKIDFQSFSNFLDLEEFKMDELLELPLFNNSCLYKPNIYRKLQIFAPNITGICP